MEMRRQGLGLETIPALLLDRVEQGNAMRTSLRERIRADPYVGPVEQRDLLGGC